MNGGCFARAKSGLAFGSTSLGLGHHRFGVRQLHATWPPNCKAYSKNTSNSTGAQLADTAAALFERQTEKASSNVKQAFCVSLGSHHSNNCTHFFSRSLSVARSRCSLLGCNLPAIYCSGLSPASHLWCRGHNNCRCCRRRQALAPAPLPASLQRKSNMAAVVRRRVLP